MGVTLVERFEAKFLRTDDEDGCWLWKGALRPDGYGRFFVKGRVRLAHRVAMEIVLGRKLLSEECVLHSCDTPACVRPKHLFLGDRIINNEDRTRKGRSARMCGARNGRAVLSDADVLEIHRRWGLGENGPTLGAAFGVTRSRIYQIVHGPAVLAGNGKENHGTANPSHWR